MRSHPIKRQRIEKPQPGLALMLSGVVLTASLSSGGMLHAEVTFDGTVGTPGTLSGPDFQINADRGRQVGSNLFHSFSQFNLSNAESATFNGTPDITNVISRVTGGSVSSINGNLNVAIPKANFFFINPAGVIIGPDASINVEGAVSLSTADYLNFLNDGRFDASDVGKTVLSVGDPKGYGFLGSTVGDITVESRKISTNGQDISLVGGNIILDGGNTDYATCVPAACANYDPQLETSGGDVNLVGVTGAGLVTRGESGMTVDDTQAGGTVKITKQYAIDTSGAGAGGVYIRSGQLVIEESNIVAITHGAKAGKPVDIQTQDTTLSNAYIESATTSTGDGGEIHIKAENTVAIAYGSTLLVKSESGNDAGKTPGVTIEADKITLSDAGSRTPIEANITSLSGSQEADPIRLKAHDIVMGTHSFIASKRQSDGQGADIVLNAQSLSMLGGGKFSPSRIFTQGIVPGSRGKDAKAGSITLDLDLLRANDNSIINSDNNFDILSSTVNLTASNLGARGKYTLQAKSITLDDSNLSGHVVDINADDIRLRGQFAGIFSEQNESASADAVPGSLHITTNTLDIRDGARISTSTRGAAEGSSLSITAHESINLTGTASLEVLDFDRTPGFLAGFRSGIFSEAFDTGRGGDVSIHAGALTLSDGAGISTDSNGSGQGGSIDLAVKNMLTLRDKGASIETTSINIGDAGNIQVAAGDIVMKNQASINSNTRTGGNAGDVTLNVDGEISLSEFSHILSNTEADGAGGDITLRADTIKLDRSSIESETSGSGDSGDIIVDARSSIAIKNGSLVSNSTFSDGNAQTIQLTAPDLFLGGSSQIQSLSGDSERVDGVGNGGGIQIQAKHLLVSGVEDGKIDISQLAKVDHSSTFLDYLEAIGETELLALYKNELELQSKRSGGSAEGSVAGIAGAESYAPLPITGLISGQVASFADLLIDIGISNNVNAGSLSTAQWNQLGELYLDFKDNLFLRDRANAVTVISADSRAQGNAGDINIASDRFGLNNAEISSISSEAGRAGEIELMGKNLTLGNARIATNSLGFAAPGKITIKATGDIVVDGSEISSENATENNGGLIAVNGGKSITLKNKSLISTAASSDGDASDIHLDAPLIKILGGSRVTSTSGIGPLTFVASPFTSTPVYSLPYVPTYGAGGSISLVADKVVLADKVFWSPTSFTKYLEDHGEAGFSKQYSLFVGNPGYFDTPTPVEQKAFNQKASVLSDQWYQQTQDTIRTIREENSREPGGLFSASYTEGDAGNIQINAHDIEITGKAQISSLTSKTQPSYDDNFNEIFVQKQSSDGGDIKLTADRISIESSGRSVLPVTDRVFQFIIDLDEPVLNQAGLYASANTTTGTAGNISLNGTDIRIANGAVVSSESIRSGGGGNIQVVGNTITVNGVNDLNNPMGAITNITANATDSSGPAGSVSLLGKEIAVADGALITTDTDTKETDMMAGDAGSILLEADEVHITDGAVLASTTQHNGGHGGAITINARNRLDVSGQYHGAYTKPLLRYSDPMSGQLTTTLLASTSGVSDGGAINLHGGRITLSDKARINARTTAMGESGSITISGKTLEVLSKATLDAASTSTGHAGNIELRGEQSVKTQDADISTASSGDGEGGSITINAPQVHLLSSTITSQSDGASTGGAIRIEGDDLGLEDGTILRASNTGNGDAGTITLATSSTIQVNDSKISTEALAGGGGNIKLLTGRLLRLDHAGLSTSVLGSDGSAGNIFIDPDVVLLKDSTIQANAVNGKGGSIRVQAGILMQDASSIIDASSEYGVDGTVVIDAPILQLQRETKRTKKAAKTLIRNRCRAKSAGHSSFTMATSFPATYTPQLALITMPSDIYIEEQYVIPNGGQRLVMMSCSE